MGPTVNNGLYNGICVKFFAIVCLHGEKIIYIFVETPRDFMYGQHMLQIAKSENMVDRLQYVEYVVEYAE
jgi:hypothetical protein